MKTWAVWLLPPAVLGLLLLWACLSPKASPTPLPVPQATSAPQAASAPTPVAAASPTPTPQPAAAPASGFPPLVPLTVEVSFPRLPPLERMVHLAHAGDGSNRLWAVLQPGRILVFPNDPSVSFASLFLDIRDKVNDQGDEEGLLGLAFDPNYAQNGYFYVNYTAANPRRSVSSRFSVSSPSSDQADARSELVILEVAQPFPNHNGGTLAFGPDGYLYIGLGDGGGRGDPLSHAQNKATLLGAILRIDVSRATAQMPYRIPADNPFVGVAAARGEIWAYGLRNPWKFAFDAVDGDLWAGDVGQNAYEEIDLIKRGGNYGWNLMEGRHCYPNTAQICTQPGLELPIWEYDHSAGCSITGGYVYRGKRLPTLAGAYVYADFCSGRIWALRYDGSTVTDHIMLAKTDLRISSFGLDEVGELYIIAYDGYIYRFAQ